MPVIGDYPPPEPVKCLLLVDMTNSLFVFSIGGTKQNARSLLTPVSDTVFNALSHGSLGFAFHGGFFNHFLIGSIWGNHPLLICDVGAGVIQPLLSVYFRGY